MKRPSPAMLLSLATTLGTTPYDLTSDHAVKNGRCIWCGQVVKALTTTLTLLMMFLLVGWIVGCACGNDTACDVLHTFGLSLRRGG